VGGVTYNDVVTRTADGWRIAERSSHAATTTVAETQSAAA
jgi:hypothetical protein